MRNIEELFNGKELVQVKRNLLNVLYGDTKTVRDSIKLIRQLYTITEIFSGDNQIFARFENYDDIFYVMDLSKEYQGNKSRHVVI